MMGQKNRDPPSRNPGYTWISFVYFSSIQHTRFLLLTASFWLKFQNLRFHPDMLDKGQRCANDVWSYGPDPCLATLKEGWGAKSLTALPPDIVSLKISIPQPPEVNFQSYFRSVTPWLRGLFQRALGQMDSGRRAKIEVSWRRESECDALKAQVSKLMRHFNNASLCHSLNKTRSFLTNFISNRHHPSLEVEVNW